MKNILLTIVFLVFTSVTIFAQWEIRDNGLPETYSHGWAVDAVGSFAIISLTSPLGHIYKTTNYGIEWISENNWPFAHDLSITDNLHFWFVKDAIYATTDGGLNWVIQFKDTNITSTFNYIEMFDNQNGISMADAKNSNDPAVILKTTDGGNNWISVNNSNIGGWTSNMWYHIDFVDLDNGYFYPYGIEPRHLYKTTDGCNAWVPTNLTGYVYSFKFHDINYGMALIQNVGGTLASITTNGGITWNNYNTPALNTWAGDIEFLPEDPSKIWFGDRYGIYFSSDSGKTWTKANLPLDELFAGDLVFIDHTHGYCLTDSLVLFTSTADRIVGLKNEILNLPKSFALFQNYPNPFNPSTVIKFELSSNSFVSLIVYDILGNKIETIVNELKPAGIHSVNFNNEEIPSGIYFYKISITTETDNFFETKKMVLLR